MKKAPSKVVVVNLVLILAIGGAGFLGWTATHPAKATTTSVATSRVMRGDVQSTVSASGKVISPADIGVAPLTAGILKTLNVKVGQSVSAGDVMAQLDTTSLSAALKQAKLALISAKAAVSSSLTQLQSLQDAVTTAQKNLDQQNITLAQNAVTYQASVDAAKKSVDDTTANQVFSAKTYQTSIDTAKASVDAAQLNYDNYLGLYGPSGITVPWCSTIQTINANCTQLMNYYQTLNNAKTAYASAQQNQTASLLKDQQALDSLKTSYNTALLNQKNNLAKDQNSLDTFKTALTNAQVALANYQAQQNVGGDQSTAQLQYEIAQDNLATAQRNFDSATIKAPVAGVVASISTAVGGNVGTNATQATATTSAAGFIVLTKVSALRVYASFSEADAAKVASGQSVTFTFDALPNATATGKVIQLDLLPTTSSGATTYGATMTVEGKVSGLKAGMTASATVVIGEAKNVLMVASTAVSTRGGSSYVNVVTTDSKGVQTQKRTNVIVGLKGDSYDEIQGGVKEGDRVATSTSTRSTSSSNSNGFPNGGVPNGFGALSGSVVGGGAGGGRNFNGGGRG